MSTQADTATDIAIIGDRFMLSDMFEAALLEACGARVACRKLDLPWPDEPMEHGYAAPGMDGLKEYMGDPDAVVAHVGAAPVLVTHLAPLSAAMFDRMPALRLVAVSRGGPVNIDMAAARARCVTVVNTQGRNASAVAEFAIGAILAQTRNITAGHDALRRGDWRGDLYRADVTGEELSELVVGVIGYGAIGTRVVRLLRAFGARVLVADPYVQLSAADAADGVRLVDRDTLLAEADVVTLHARVTEETTGFLDANAFARMKRGAMLETFAVEPAPPDERLLRLPNVTLTPHIAGASLKTVKIAARNAAEEVRRHLCGEPPLNPC